MKIFLSYASQQKELARPVCASLRAAAFSVFFDESDLPAADTFDDRLREAVLGCDLLVFLLSPEAVMPGRYTLTELGFAATRWPNPRGHVLAVLPLDTVLPVLPDYLKPLTLQRQVGNLAAEVLATVRRLQAEAAAGAAAVPAASAAASPTLPSDEPGGASYEALDLRFRAGAPGAYVLGLAGAAEVATAALPEGVDPQAIEAALWHDAQPVAGTARRGDDSAPVIDRMPSAEAARQVGAQLHALMFAPPWREPLRASLRRIDRQRSRGLRFVINTTDAAALARLPWELAYDAQRREFIFADPMKPVVRWLDVDEALPTLALRPPLRLLIAVAAPPDQPALAVGDELAHLDRALADLGAQGLVQVQRLDHATLAALDQALLSQRPHLLHFIGHGDFSGGEGVVLFEAAAPGSAAVAVSGQRLAVLLRNHLQSLRLVFLNSCLGASAAPRDPFGGVAQALVGHGVPAVIAMQFAIPDASAVALAQQFYRYLAAGRPVDQALTSARAFLVATGSEVEWAAPVLTMHAPDGRLFDLAAARAAPAYPPAPWSTVPSQTPAAPPPIPPAAGAPATADLGPGLRSPEDGPDDGPSAAVHRPGPAGEAPRASPDEPGGDLAVRSAPSRWRWLPILAGLLLLAAALLWVLLPSYQWSGSAAPAAKSASPDAVPDAASRPSPPAAMMPGQGSKSSSSKTQSMPQSGLFRLAEAVLEAQRQLDAGQAPQALATLQAVLRPGPGQPALLLGDGTLRWLQSLLRDIAEALPADDALAARQLARDLDAFHTVRPGDNLWTIARQRYGDGRRWPELQRANADLRDGTTVLQPGQRLRVPPHPSVAEDLRYTVQPGDSLWRLAAHFYGDGRHWPLIQAANAGRIADPDRLPPGLVLSIPAAH